MIEVEVHYYQKHTKSKSKNDYFVYPYFLIKGHANNGKTSLECERVCAGISASVMGLLRLIDTTQYKVNVKSGYFEITSMGGQNGWIDQDTNYGLNTLLCIIFDLWNTYPHQFKRFEMIEIKENEENYVKPKRPKPFRKLKEQLGVRSN